MPWGAGVVAPHIRMWFHIGAAGGHRPPLPHDRSLFRRGGLWPPSDLPPSRGKAAWPWAMPDEGGPGDASGPTHRSAPAGYHGVMLSKAKHPFSPSLFRRQGPGDGFFGLRPQNDEMGEWCRGAPESSRPTSESGFVSVQRAATGRPYPMTAAFSAGAAFGRPQTLLLPGGRQHGPGP